MSMHWGSLAAGIGAYVIALIASAPATLADTGLQRASGGRLRLAEARGTLWSGAGQIEILDAAKLNGVARSIAWRVVPASLLRGQLEFDVGLEQSSSHFPVTLSPSRLELGNADISLPAAVLGLGLPRLAPLGLAGDVSIHIAGLSVANDGMAGNASLQWRAAASALTTVSPLGDFEVHINAAGTAVHATLSTLAGPLQLEGKGTWSESAPPNFLATARIPAQHQEQLAPLLRLIAVERGAGDFEINSTNTMF
jgi:general secretion pathway protein N